MPPLAEYCLGNVDSEARRALRESSCEVRESFCLDRCGKCYAEPFLVVDGEVVDGASHRDLLREIESTGVTE